MVANATYGKASSIAFARTTAFLTDSIGGGFDVAFFWLFFVLPEAKAAAICYGLSLGSSFGCISRRRRRRRVFSYRRRPLLLLRGCGVDDGCEVDASANHHRTTSATFDDDDDDVVT